ncbi:murein biosynthesis integral membrane protein MurJ [Trueperella sp.]|uniref:murein biosynthesis integral membrane protein MurJ n=1 Tax=Trueperella sp. TaxID=2699835 RepID=UPI0037357DF0
MSDFPYRARHGEGYGPATAASVPGNKPAPEGQAPAGVGDASAIAGAQTAGAGASFAPSGAAEHVRTAGLTQAEAAKAGPDTEQIAVVGKDTARSSFVMFLGTLVSRILGFVKSPFLMGAVVGLNSSVAGSWDIANKLPNLLYMVIAGGLVNAVLVPAIVRATKESKDSGQDFINKLLTLTMVAMGAITLLLTLLAPVIVKIFASTLRDDWYSLTVLFAYWSLPQIFFYGLYTVFGQILNARENFGPYMWAPVANNVVAIGGLLVILAIWGSESATDPSPVSAWMGVRASTLAGVSTLGIVIQALILIIPLRKEGIRFRPDFQWRGSGLGRAGRASMWVLGTVVLGLVPTILLTTAAAGATTRAVEMGIPVAEVASNAAYTAAYALYSLPTSLITVSVTTAVFTRMARAAAHGRHSTLATITSQTLRIVATFNFLAAAGLIALSLPLSRLMLPFVSVAEIRSLAPVLATLTLGLIGVGAVTVFNRVYYALEDTRGAFFIGLPWQAMGVIGFSASMLLPPRWVVVGIAFTMALSNILASIVMYLVLRKRLGGFDDVRLISTHVRLGIAAVVAGFVGWLWVNVFGLDAVAASVPAALGAIVVGGVIIVAIYLILAYLLKVDEVAHILSPLAKITEKIRGKIGR